MPRCDQRGAVTAGLTTLGKDERLRRPCMEREEKSSLSALGSSAAADAPPFSFCVPSLQLAGLWLITMISDWWG
jgi:hypothetical protein